MNIDYESARERILELESELEDAFVVIDLQQEENNELREENRVLRAQVQNMLIDHRYPDLKAG